MRPRPRNRVTPSLILFSILCLLVAPLMAQEIEPEAEEQASSPAVAARKAPGEVYIVRLSEPPVLAYEGNIAGLRATKPAKGRKLNPNDRDVIQYAAYLDSRHNAVAAKVNARKVYDYRYSVNGFSAKMTASDAAKLRNEVGVVAIEKAQEVVMDTSTTPTFLGLTDPVNGLWTRFGTKGEDVIIGVVDSGVWPESRSFTDRTGTGPNGQEGKLGYHQIPGWHGKCVPGEEFNASHCNQKLIGAQYFCEARGCENVLEHEYISPRGYNGHGTHTASTAGGNENVALNGASAVAVSGIAPRARIAVYKVCWDNGAGQCGANSADSVAAIDQAVIDGVDVINYSISGTSTNYLDSVEVAYLFASDAGVFVATSAGNSGPTVSTVAHISPWLAATAAGTHNRATAGTGTFTRGDGTTQTGVGSGIAVASAPLILGANAGLPGSDPGMAAQCFSADAAGNPVLDPLLVTGKIVVCQRAAAGTIPVPNARLDKSLAVKNAGGVGVIIYNTTTTGTTNDDPHTLPTVHISGTAGNLLLGYIASTPTPTAALNRATFATVVAPNVSNFSSRGPSLAGVGDILKPDFMAPGSNVLAAVSPASSAGAEFGLLSGTSMSSPHVAGIAALLKERHPDWSPAAIRSAIATTADPFVRTSATVTVLGSPFNVGSGQVRPNLADNPGLVYDAGFNDYLSFLKGQLLISNPVPAVDASDLNQPSIAIGDLAGIQTIKRTVTNVGGSKATYTSTLVAPPGFVATVTPSTLVDIPAGGKASYTVAFTRSATPTPFGVFQLGSLTWSDGTHVARSPITVRPVAFGAPAEILVGGVSGSTQYAIRTGYDGNLGYSKNGLVASTKLTGVVADDPTDNFVANNPNGNQGISPHDIVVPAGTQILRFTMLDEETDGEDDIDLYLYRIGVNPATGAPTFTSVGTSGGGTSAEQITLNNPTAATYRVFVHGWQTDGPDAQYTLHAWVMSATDAGNMTVNGPSTAVLGGPGVVTVGWSGLTAGERYIGRINYLDGADPKGSTIVRVDP